jgi:hypothetical protein
MARTSLFEEFRVAGGRSPFRSTAISLRKDARKPSYIYIIQLPRRWMKVGGASEWCQFAAAGLAMIELVAGNDR